MSWVSRLGWVQLLIWNENSEELSQGLEYWTYHLWRGQKSQSILKTCCFAHWSWCTSLAPVGYTFKRLIFEHIFPKISLPQTWVHSETIPVVSGDSSSLPYSVLDFVSIVQGCFPQLKRNQLVFLVKLPNLMPLINLLVIK